MSVWRLLFWKVAWARKRGKEVKCSDLTERGKKGERRLTGRCFIKVVKSVYSLSFIIIFYRSWVWEKAKCSLNFMYIFAANERLIEIWVIYFCIKIMCCYKVWCKVVYLKAERLPKFLLCDWQPKERKLSGTAELWLLKMMKHVLEKACQWCAIDHFWKRVLINKIDAFLLFIMT